MKMDVDAGGSDFETLDSDAPPPKKKAAAKPKKAPAKAKAPAKKAPAKGRGKKAAVVSCSMSLHFSCALICNKERVGRGRSD